MKSVFFMYTWCLVEDFCTFGFKLWILNFDTVEVISAELFRKTDLLCFIRYDILAYNLKHSVGQELKQTKQNWLTINRETVSSSNQNISPDYIGPIGLSTIPLVNDTEHLTMKLHNNEFQCHYFDVVGNWINLRILQNN